MDKDNVKNIIDSSPEERCDYFVKTVLNSEELWLINDDSNYIMLTDKDGNEVLPIWPEKQFAAALLIDDWKNFEVSAFNLWEFIQWCKDLKLDNTKILVFPIADLSGITIDTDEMENRIEEEDDKYWDNQDKIK